MIEFSIVTVSAFVATLNEITKKISSDVFKKDISRFIPIFSILYGLILGLISWFAHINGFGENVIEAAFIGISSGAAATGYHQIGKQLSKKEDTVTDEATDGVEEVDLSTPQSDFDLLDVTDVDDNDEDLPEIDVDEVEEPLDTEPDIDIDIE